MATVKISRVNSIVASLKYVLNEQSHDGIHERVGAISCLNTTQHTAIANALNLLEKTNKLDKAQGYTMIQSFSTEELNPDDPNSLSIANRCAMETARRVWGEDRQIVVVTQADNGKVHSHIIGVSPRITDGKSLRDKELSWREISKVADEVLKEQGVLNLNADKVRKRGAKSTIAEIKRREKGLYVWKDDLRERIDDCINDPQISDLQTLVQELKKRHDVDVKVTKKNITFIFTDKDGEERKARRRSLGDDYGKEEVNARLTNTQPKRAEQITIPKIEPISEYVPKRRKRKSSGEDIRRRAEVCIEQSSQLSEHSKREIEFYDGLIRLAQQQARLSGEYEEFQQSRYERARQNTRDVGNERRAPNRQHTKPMRQERKDVANRKKPHFDDFSTRERTNGEELEL